jgi:hypothetical protein
MHHAVLFRDDSLPLTAVLTTYGKEVDNYEITELVYPNLGIVEVRKLISSAMMTPNNGTHRLLLVRTSSIGHEAQHALLKILEEPPSSTLFVFLVAKNVSLLPTVLSRFQKLSTSDVEVVTGAGATEFEKFLNLSYSDRLEEIKKRMTKKDQLWTQDIREGFGQYLSQSKKLDTEQKASLLFVFNLLTTRGASNKMLLEFLALTLTKGAQK